MTTRDVLDRLARIGPPIINATCRPNEPHCVLSSSVGQIVLGCLGIVAEPFPAQVSVTNQEWERWQAEGAPGGRDEQMRRGAYIITNAPDWAGPSFVTTNLAKAWDGHLALRVQDTTTAWLVDLDCGSFVRPMRSIYLPLGMVAPLFADEGTQGIYTVRGVETTITYHPLVAPYRDDYQTARDWIERDRFKPLSLKILRAMGVKI